MNDTESGITEEVVNCWKAPANEHNDDLAYTSNQVASIIEAKVAAERERCAHLAELRGKLELAALIRSA